MLNKKFGVFGLGISGIATMKYLKSKAVDFVAFDDKKAQIEKIIQANPKLASHIKNLEDQRWHNIDYLVLSPGIALTHPVTKMVKKVICDIELFYLDNSQHKFIGITGTNGKSTTTALITHILKYNGINAMLGGNIGVPVLELDASDKQAVFVFEVSSFQLDMLDETKFDISLLLNITPDHLDRHGNMENYRRTKYKIFANQTLRDYAVINVSLDHNDEMFTFSESQVADLVVEGNLLKYANKEYQLPYNNSLLGKHNQQNIAASIACLIKFGLNLEQIIAALPSFVGLKHRMQYIKMHNQVTFINDSKATNADSSSNALASFDNIIWIVGGIAKEGGIESLVEYFPKVKTALLIGEAQDEFAITCGDKLRWQKCNDLANAFKVACTIAAPGDVILLSPACASYDQWKSFEERGDGFIKLVEEFISSSFTR